MTITIAMPQLGLTMTEATVSQWLKKPGDAVKKDEALLSVSTDKVDMDIEASVDGVLREIIVEQGQTVPVGTALAYLDTEGRDVSAPPPTPVSPTVELKDNSSLAQAVAGNPNPSRIKVEALAAGQRDKPFEASPRARRRARELGIDLAAVKGSGAEGRIFEKDLLHLAAAQPTSAVGPSDTKRRQLIADRMVESIRTIPSFSVSLEVNAESLVSLYKSFSEPKGQRAGSMLTYTDLLLRALALSLRDTPTMNAVWEEGAVRPRGQINLGLAVGTDRGVVAPVLADVDRLSLVQTVMRRAELVDKARQNRLTFADFEGGAGTLSNLGMYRIDRFEGIISPGQSFILAVGKLGNRPWVDGSLVIKPTVILNLSADHRVADGVTAAIFLQRIAEVIENPYRVLFND